MHLYVWPINSVVWSTPCALHVNYIPCSVLDQTTKLFPPSDPNLTTPVLYNLRVCLPRCFSKIGNNTAAYFSLWHNVLTECNAVYSSAVKKVTKRQIRFIQKYWHQTAETNGVIFRKIINLIFNDTRDLCVAHWNSSGNTVQYSTAQ